MSQTDDAVKLYRQFSRVGMTRLCDMFFKCPRLTDLVDVAILFRDLSDETRASALEYMTAELEHDKQHTSNTAQVATPPQPDIATQVVEMGRKVGFDVFSGVLAVHHIILSKPPGSEWPAGLDVIIRQSIPEPALLDALSALIALDRHKGGPPPLVGSEVMAFPLNATDEATAKDVDKMLASMLGVPVNQVKELLAQILPPLAGMPPTPETGWLIERGDGTCLGPTPCGKGTEWTTPALAIRFAREVDAAGAVAALVPNGQPVRITEHQWG